MRLKCPDCNVEAMTQGGVAHWTCPECNQVIAEPTEETCQAAQGGKIAKDEFVVFDSCQDCMHFSCPVQPVDAEEMRMQDELKAMFGDDDEAVDSYQEGHASDKENE